MLLTPFFGVGLTSMKEIESACIKLIPQSQYSFINLSILCVNFVSENLSYLICSYCTFKKNCFFHSSSIYMSLIINNIVFTDIFKVECSIKLPSLHIRNIFTAEHPKRFLVMLIFGMLAGHTKWLSCWNRNLGLLIFILSISKFICVILTIHANTCNILI